MRELRFHSSSPLLLVALTICLLMFPSSVVAAVAAFAPPATFPLQLPSSYSSSFRTFNKVKSAVVVGGQQQQQQHKAKTTTKSSLSAMMVDSLHDIVTSVVSHHHDPITTSNILSSSDPVQQTLNEFIQQHHHATATTTTAPSSIEHLMSTMFSPSVTLEAPQKSLDIIKRLQETDPSYLHQPATVHTQSVFAPPSSVNPKLLNTIKPIPGPGLHIVPDTYLKSDDIIRQNWMPGFTPTGTILPRVDPDYAQLMRKVDDIRHTSHGHYPLQPGDAEAMESDFKVISRVVMTAFVYTVVDFFVIPKGKERGIRSDIYASDLDDMTNEERTEYINKFISTAGVRLAIISIIGIICWYLPV